VRDDVRPAPHAGARFKQEETMDDGGDQWNPMVICGEIIPLWWLIQWKGALDLLWWAR
jgi:hypothetical protein